MPNYSVHFKTPGERDHQFWTVGPFPDRDLALHHFNAVDAKKAGIGPFTYEETDKLLRCDYLMEEQEGMGGHRKSFWLYPVK